MVHLSEPPPPELRKGNPRVLHKSRKLISVIIPTRNESDIQPFVYKSLENQTYDEFEVIVVSGINNQVNRNKGAGDAKGDFLFFCDDDIELHRGCFQNLKEALDNNPKKSYSYCNYNRVGLVTGTLQSRPFNAGVLRLTNYISTMSLIRREAFELSGGFDEEIGRLQDWDLWLSMLDKGMGGVFVDRVLFTAHYLRKDGISVQDDNDWIKWNQIVKGKHHL